MTQTIETAPDSFSQPSNPSMDPALYTALSVPARDLIINNPELYMRQQPDVQRTLASLAFAQRVDTPVEGIGDYTSTTINDELNTRVGNDDSAYTIDDVAKSLARTAREKAAFPTSTEVVNNAYVRPDVAEAAQPRRTPPAEAATDIADRSHLQPGRDYRSNQRLADLRRRRAQAS